MIRVLVIHGAGMNMRGKTMFELFGPLTLQQYDECIKKYAESLDIQVEIFHSNIEGQVIDKIYDAHDRGIDAMLINPSGYTVGYPALAAAIAQVKFLTIEVHLSNPAQRGLISQIAPVSRVTISGAGVFSYYLALLSVREIVVATRSSESK